MEHSIHACTSCGSNVRPAAEPRPLIKRNYLSEFRTELEKAKARENLGISDGLVLAWGNLKGKIEEQEDLVQFFSKMPYDNEAFKDTKTIGEVLDYLIELSTNKDNTLQTLTTGLQNLKDEISKEGADGKPVGIKPDVDYLKELFSQLTSLIKLDSLLKDHLDSSLVYTNDKLLVRISEEDNNIIENKADGLYAKKDIYTSEISDDTKAELASNVTADLLKGKDLSLIVETLFFPVKVRSLLYPRLLFSSVPSIVEVGTKVEAPTATYYKNDGGDMVGDIEYSQSGSYDTLNTVTYSASVSYEAGPYLKNNRGEESTVRVEAGKTSPISAKVSVVYPWYYGNENETSKELRGGDRTITLAGYPWIKYPSNYKTLSGVQVEASAGLFLPVSGWEENTVTEKINGKDIEYKIFSKIKLNIELPAITYKFKIQ